MRQWTIVGSVGPPYWPGLSAARMCGPAGPFYGLGPAWAEHETSWAVPQDDVPEDERALLTRYAFRDDTFGSWGFISAVSRTAGPRSFGGEGP